MDLNTWLDEEKGRAAALAQHFEISDAAVSQWRVDGVPKRRMKATLDFTAGAVTLDDMVPNVRTPSKEGAAHG